MAARFVYLLRTRLIFSQVNCSVVKFVQKSNYSICPKLSASKISHANPIFSIISRNYSKGKDRKKDNKQKKVVINENILGQVADVEQLKIELDKVVTRMKEEYVKHFTLRSSLGALDTLPVEFEGTDYTLQDVAQIGKKSTNMYVVNMASFPQLIPSVLKSIEASGLGLNPQQDGTTLFIPVPKVTKEHRETMAKNAKAVFIKTRDNLRDVQNKFIKNAKKEHISEDVLFSAKEQIAHLADIRIAEAEDMLKKKQAELLA